MPSYTNLKDAASSKFELNEGQEALAEKNPDVVAKQEGVSTEAVKKKLAASMYGKPIQMQVGSGPLAKYGVANKMENNPVQLKYK